MSCVLKTVTYSDDALEDLKRYRNVAARLRRALAEYAADPRARANNVTQFVGSTARRIRVGDFRAIFEETDAELLVTKVGPRGNVYD